RMQRLALRGSPLIICILLLAAPAAALDVQVKDLYSPLSSVTTTIELRDLLPDRFRKTLDDGGALHLRVQAELWESRPVWDRLVYPLSANIGETRSSLTIRVQGEQVNRS
ncbi:MAG TPA: hypothetical protein VK531_11345, partial [Gemmatimonadales bacterium]|nr:hypothetical protein [Gemmatimonadales bacterium]